MSTLVTPSAKSHERVSGRWDQDIQAVTKRDWASFYIKMIFGSPVPWLFTAYLLFVFINPAISFGCAWAAALLVVVYVVADRFSRSREFGFFFIGPDAGVICFSLLILLTWLFGDTPGLDAIQLSWALLAYLFAYSLELFPGLNRMFFALFAVGVLSSAYSIVQHFAGQDWITGLPLHFAPLVDNAYFSVQGFGRAPEIAATLTAMLLPLPVAAYLAAERRHSFVKQSLALALCALFMISVLWSYRPGMWVAALVGALIALVIQSQRQIKFILFTVALVAAIVTISYSSPHAFWSSVKDFEMRRATVERTQINKYFEAFTQNILTGSHAKLPTTLTLPSDDSKLGANVSTEATYFSNIYFEILGRFGLVGILCYFAIILPSLMFSYRLFREIPPSHYWHRVLVTGLVAGQIAFHICGLYWSTISCMSVTSLYAFFIAIAGYMHHHYSKGLVSDDHAL